MSDTEELKPNLILVLYLVSKISFVVVSRSERRVANSRSLSNALVLGPERRGAVLTDLSNALVLIGGSMRNTALVLVSDGIIASCSLNKEGFGTKLTESG